MRIILDGMGGDHAPYETVKGAVLASLESDYEIAIVGREEDIYRELSKYKYDNSRISVINATEVITNEDSPVKAIRKKQDSSMVKGIHMIKEGKGDVFVSAGNTGAYMAGSLLILGRIEGIDRPAITCIYPIVGGIPSIIVDAGANAECKPNNLLEFAIMGSIYMEKVFERDNPVVGLANIGVEEKKGNTLTKEAYQLLKTANINFMGNVEARDIPYGAADVIVCDGFTGNIILKVSEGFALNMMKELKKTFTSGLSAKMGAAMLAGKIKDMKKDFDYSSYGGAPILGVNGHIIKMHGSSDSNAVKNAILRSAVFAEGNVVGQISAAMEEISIDRETGEI